MVRARSAVASRRHRKRILKQAKGFWGDRSSHIRQSRGAVLKALSFATAHRRKKKGDFRRLWITRIGVAAKINGLSYSRMIDGLHKAGCIINRKMLSEMAINDPTSFAEVASVAKQAL